MQNYYKISTKVQVDKIPTNAIIHLPYIVPLNIRMQSLPKRCIQHSVLRSLLRKSVLLLVSKILISHILLR